MRSSSPLPPLPRPPPRKTRYLVSVPANCHGTPPPAVGSRGITKKQPATRIRANPDARFSPLHQNFRRGARNRRQQPVQPALTRDKFQLPVPTVLDQIVVALRNAQDLVDRLHP